MLDDAKQVAAFRLLQQNKNRQPAGSISVSNRYNAAATTIADNLDKLVTHVATPGGPPVPVYTTDAQVVAQVNIIKGFITTLRNAATAGKTFTDVLAPCDSIRELVNLSIGYDCYVKANNMPASTPFPVVTALANSVEVGALNTAVAGVVTLSLDTAMVAINKAMTPTSTPAAGGSGSPTTTPAPGPTAAQKTALTTAVTALQPKLAAVTQAIGPVNTLHQNASKAFDDAQQAFDDAVEIALIVALKSDARMAAAITALVPANVLAALA